MCVLLLVDCHTTTIQVLELGIGLGLTSVPAPSLTTPLLSHTSCHTTAISVLELGYGLGLTHH